MSFKNPKPLWKYIFSNKISNDLQIAYIKWEQNHRAFGTYKCYKKSIKITSSSKHNTQKNTEHRKTKRKCRLTNWTK